MSHPIRDRVHLIELPLGPTRTVNAVLIDGDPLTLVDTGLKTPESLAALERGFAEHGLKLSDLEQIVITHPHNDHFGAAAELARRSGARVIGDGAAVTAAFPESFRPNTEMRVSYFEEAGAPDEVASFWRQRRSNLSDNTEAVEMATGLADGDTVRMGGADWQVVSTPGHAETSISLYQPDARLLIAGDILIGNAGASVTLHAMPRPGRWLLQIFDSLDRLGALDAERAFPGHGPVIEDAGRVIPVRRQRAAQRLEEVAGMVRERPWSAFQLSTTIYPPPIGTNFMGLSQSIGYLEALVCQERARSELRGGVREYEPS
jgi:glyoxylase-like metal-dependent hydrolase (beta-lactamase superfamily II)